MTELDPITQELVFEDARALAALETLIAMEQRLVDMTGEVLVAMRAMQASVDALHGKEIDIAVNAPDAVNTLSKIDSALNSIGNTADAKTGKISELQQAIRDLGMSEADVAALSGVASEAFINQGKAADSKRDQLLQLQLATDLISDSEAGLRVRAGEVVAALEAAGSAADRNALKYWQLREAGQEVGLSEEELARMSNAAGAALAGQGQEAQSKADKLRELMQVYNVLTSAEESTLWIPKEQAQMMGWVATESDKAGAAAAKSATLFTLWGTGIGVTAWGLHWLISGSAELLAVLIPAIIAAGDAALVMAEGFTWAKDRVNAMFTATEATSAMLHQTTGTVLGLKDSLQQAQTAADPQVWEIFGAGVNAAKEAFGGFWQQGLQVVHMLDTFAAHVDLSLGPGGVLGSQAQGAIHSMVGDLQGLGQVLGNVGHLLLTFATDMPGIAEVILHTIAAVTGLANSLAQLKWVGLGLTGFMIIEEIGRWGGLAMIGIAPLIKGLGTMLGMAGVAASEMTVMGVSMAGVGEAALGAGAAVEGMGAEVATAGAMTKTFWGALLMPFTTLPGQLLLVAGGLTAMIILLNSAKSAAVAMADSMENAISASSPAKGMVELIQDLPIVQRSADQAATAQQNLSKAWEHGTGAAHAVAGVVAATSSQTTALSGTYNTMITQMADLLGWNAKIGGSQYSLAEAIGLASAAGVQMNQMFDQQGRLTSIATQMIRNLIAGYQMMAQTGTTLAQDINAIDVQTLMQQTDVQKLNQAWDSFMQMVTGGTSAFATLNSDLLTMGNVTQTATSKITAFSKGSQGTALNVDQIAQSLKSFSGTSAQVWQNFNAGVTQAGQLTDWLRTAAATGAVSNQQYTNSIKGIVAELLPYAKDSGTAASELEALAQQAGGPAVGGYQALKQWIGNTDQAQKNLNGTVQSATQYMANLSQVAANLSATLNSEVDSALAQGTVNIKGIAGAAQNFEAQLQHGKQGTNQFTGALLALIGQLLAAGEPVKSVTGIIDTMAGRAGYNTAQIEAMNAQIGILAQKLDSIHSVSATVNITTVETTYSKYIDLPGTYGPGGPTVGHHAAGWRVPGYGGGDKYPAMLEGGEAVVPKHLVPAVAPFLGAHGVPGFESGGMIGHHGYKNGPPLTPMEKILEQWSREIWREDEKRYGKKGPISLGEMRKLMAPFGKHDKYMSNPQYRVFAGYMMDHMEPYYKDEEAYQHSRAQMKDLARQEKIKIDRYEKYIKHEPHTKEGRYWAEVYRKDIESTKKYFDEQMKRVRAKEEKELDSLGYSRGGRVPFGVYDQGGYLPVGLSMAMNNTGKPEPVGGVGGEQVIHVHINLDGRELANAMVPANVGATNRYTFRNSGRPTGLLRPS